MSKHHQASRRRSYGRRQHELRERPEPGSVGFECAGLLAGPGGRVDHLVAVRRVAPEPPTGRIAYDRAG